MNPNEAALPVVARIEFPTGIIEASLWLLLLPPLFMVTQRMLRDLAARNELVALAGVAAAGLALRLLVPFGPQQWYFGMSNVTPGPGILVNRGSFQPLPNRFLIFRLGLATLGIETFNLLLGTSAILLLGYVALRGGFRSRTACLFAVLIAVTPLYVRYSALDGPHALIVLLFAAAAAAYCRLATGSGDGWEYALLVLGVILAAPNRIESTLPLMSMPFFLFHSGAPLRLPWRDRPTLVMAVAGAAGAGWLIAARFREIGAAGGNWFPDIAVATIISDVTLVLDPLPGSWLPIILVLPVWIEAVRLLRARAWYDLASLWAPFVFCLIPSLVAGLNISPKKLGYQIIGALFLLLASARCVDSLWDRVVSGEILITPFRRWAAAGVVIPLTLLSLVPPYFSTDVYQDEFHFLRDNLPQGPATVLVLADKGRVSADYDCCLSQPYPVLIAERPLLKWVVVDQDDLPTQAYRRAVFDYYYPGSLASLIPESHFPAWMVRVAQIALRLNVQSTKVATERIDVRDVNVNHLHELDARIRETFPLVPFRSWSKRLPKTSTGRFPNDEMVLTIYRRAEPTADGQPR